MKNVLPETRKRLEKLNYYICKHNKSFCERKKQTQMDFWRKPGESIVCVAN